MKHVPTELPVKIDDLLDLAEDQQWKIERTGKNHYKLTSPTGLIVGHSSTPSDHRAVMNFRAELKRKGLLPYSPPPIKPTVAAEPQQVEYFKSTPIEDIKVTEESKERAVSKERAGSGTMQALITKVLREHDKPPGLSTQEVYEFARVLAPKIDKKKVGQSLAYYAKTKLASKPSKRTWRLAEFGGMSVTAKSKAEDADDMEALEKALEALATLEKVIRKTIVQRKKLQELHDILAKIS